MSRYGTEVDPNAFRHGLSRTRYGRLFQPLITVTLPFDSTFFLPKIAIDWRGIPNPAVNDFWAIYPSAATPDASFIVSGFTGSTSTSGHVLVQTTPAYPSSATYEVRFFGANSFVNFRGKSAPFAIGMPVLVASPASVPRLSQVTATWSGLLNPTTVDFVAAYSAPGDANPAFQVSGFTGSLATSGSRQLTVPGGAPVTATYELRFFYNNGFQRLAVSNTFAVT